MLIVFNTKSDCLTHVTRGGGGLGGLGGMYPPEKFASFHVIFSTSNVLLLLFETNSNQLNLLHFYIIVRLLYTIISTQYTGMRFGLCKITFALHNSNNTGRPGYVR